MDEKGQREFVVSEARSWVGTPYRLGSCKKGVGVDCAQFVAAVYKSANIISADEIVPIFSHDWFCHTKEEKYLNSLMRYSKLIAETRAYKTENASPGDVLLTKAAHSKVYNHACIVIN